MSVLQSLPRLRGRVQQAWDVLTMAVAWPSMAVLWPRPAAVPRASAPLLQALSAHGSDLVAILDVRGAYRYASPSHERILGYRPADLLGTSAFDVLHPDDRPHALALFAENIVERGAPRTATLRIRHANGSWRSVEAMGTNRLFDPVVRGVIINARDITTRLEDARREAEEARQRVAFLATASEHLAASLDYPTTLASVARLAVPALADWCTVDLVEPDGTIKQMAVAHRDAVREERVRATRQDFPPDPQGKHALVQVLHTGHPLVVSTVTEEWLRAHARAPAHFQAMRELGLRSYMCVPLVARDRILGALTFSATQAGRYGADDLALATDLARRAALAVDNARLYHEAHEALRLRDGVLSTISHDLKTPVAAVLGLAQLLQQRAAKAETLDSARIAPSLARIEAAATRMTRLINELLDVARLQAGQALGLDRQYTDLVALAERMAAEHRAATESHHIQVEASVPELLGQWDAFRPERVLDNLLSNAVKYSPGGERITVTVCREDPDLAVLMVHDQGVGIPEADLRHIFDWFHRAGNVGNTPGTGLGLAAARGIVAEHGGTITVDSVVGEGTTVTVCLPCSGATS